MSHMSSSGDRSLGCFVLVLLMLATVPLPFASGDLSDLSALAGHATILITGNAQFTTANGVKYGSGTQASPYVIENWTIDAASANGIRVLNTTAWFTIRNCWVTNSNPRHYCGFWLTNATNATVEDCRVTGCHYGIYLTYMIGVTISRNNCTGVTVGIYTDYCDGSAFTDNNCSDIISGGIGLVHSERNLISNCTCSDNDYDGISLSLSYGNTVANCTCHGNERGINVLLSEHNNITDNDCTSNIHSGISVQDSRYNNISRCTCNASDGNGIDLFRSDLNTISGSNCLGSWLTGISMDSSDDNMITNCNCSGNHAVGISVFGSDSNMIRFCVCDLNRGPFFSSGIWIQGAYWNNVLNCSCSGNKNDGITLKSWGSTANNNISGCNCSDNGNDGINLFACPGPDGTRIANCTFFNNTYNGVEIAGDAYTLERNIIENCTAEQNYHGFLLDFANRNMVKDCTATSNDGCGIIITGSYSNDDRLGSDNNTVTGCTFGSNGWIGLWVDMSKDNLISDCRIYSNNGDGIWLDSLKGHDCERNRIEGCDIGSNMDAGINLAECGPNVISGCSFQGNDDEGMRLDLSESCTLSNNTVRDTHGYGILLVKSANSTITGNVIQNCTYHALSLEDSSGSLVHHNRILVNNGGGVQARDDTSNNRWNDTAGEGNLWSDYCERYVPPATQNGHVWSIPYRMDGSAGARDNYPLVDEYIDKELPVIAQDLTPDNATTGDPFTFAARVTDDIKAVGAFAEYIFDIGTVTNATMALSGGQWEATVKVDPDAISITYQLKAVDAYGKWAAVAQRTVPVLDNDEPVIHADLSDKSGTTGDVFTFEVAVSDNINVTAAWVDRWYGPGLRQARHDLENTGDYWSALIALPFDMAGDLHYRINATDAASNWNCTATRTVLVADNDPPVAVAPEDIECHPGQDATLNGSLSYDNIGIIQYGWEFTYDDSPISLRGPVATFAFETLGSYLVRLWVKDAAGLEDDGEFCVNVTLEPDVSKPEFMSVSHPATVFVGEEILITAKVVDDVQVSVVSLECTGINSTTSNTTMTHSLAAGQWSHVIPGQGAPGAVYFSLMAGDGAGNWNWTPQFEISVVEVPDTTPPRVLSTTPANNSKDVAVNSPIIIIFSEPMDTASVNSSLRLDPLASRAVIWSDNGTVLHILLKENMTQDTSYNISISPGAKDLAGNGMTNGFLLTFKTQQEPMDIDDEAPVDDITLYARIIFLALVLFIVMVLVAFYLRKKQREQQAQKPPVKRTVKKKRKKAAEEEFNVVYSYYELLGVPRSASEQEIKRAYRTLSKGAHPDSAHDATPENMGILKKRQIALNKAKETLLDPEKRGRYDRCIGYDRGVNAGNGTAISGPESEKGPELAAKRERLGGDKVEGDEDASAPQFSANGPQVGAPQEGPADSEAPEDFIEEFPPDEKKDDGPDGPA